MEVNCLSEKEGRLFENQKNTCLSEHSLMTLKAVSRAIVIKVDMDQVKSRVACDSLLLCCKDWAQDLFIQATLHYQMYEVSWGLPGSLNSI